MRTSIKFYIFFNLLLLSCNNNEAYNTQTLNIDIKSKNIAGEKLFEVTARYPMIDVYDSLLFVNTVDASNGIIKVFTPSGKLINSFAKIGKGPGEFISSICVNINKTKGTYSIYDINLKKVVLYSIINNKNHLQIKWKAKYNINNYPNKISFLSNNQFVSIGDYKEGLFGVFSTKNMNKTITYYGNYPVPTESLNSLHRFQGSLVTDETGKYIIYTPFKFGYISCYKKEQDRIIKYWEHMISEPVYEIKNNKIIFDKQKHKIGFCDLTIINNRIYALYLGYEMKKINTPSVPPGSNILLTFDLSGKLIAKRILGNYITTLDIDKNEKILYGTTIEKDGCFIYRFFL